MVIDATSPAANDAVGPGVGLCPVEHGPTRPFVGGASTPGNRGMRSDSSFRVDVARIDGDDAGISGWRCGDDGCVAAIAVRAHGSPEPVTRAYGTSRGRDARGLMERNGQPCR